MTDSITATQATQRNAKVLPSCSPMRWAAEYKSINQFPCFAALS